MEEMTIRDLHRVDKPREKLARYGVQKLSDQELVSVLLGSGTKSAGVLELSRTLLTKFPLTTLSQAPMDILQSIPGIGQAKASILLAAFELSKRITDLSTATVVTAADVWNSVHDIRNQTKEHFVIVLLNSRNQIIKYEVVSIGLVDTSIIHPREVFEPAIKHVASAVILVHNHPSGQLDPSDADIRTTKQLVECGKLLGIPVVDHVIVTSDGYLSFVQKGIVL